MAFGDESSEEYFESNNPQSNPYTSLSQGSNGRRLELDVQAVQDWIGFGNNAGVNNRGIFFAVDQGGGTDSMSHIAEGMRDGIFGTTRVDDGVSHTSISDFTSSVWTNSDLMPDQSINPRLIEYEGYNGSGPYTDGIPNNNTTAGFYQALIRTKLQKLDSKMYNKIKLK